MHGSLQTSFSATHRASAERILYAAEQGNSCHLIGARSARSSVLSQVKLALRGTGVRASQFNLSGVEPNEIPTLISVALGLGGAAASSAVTTWLRLTEFFQGSQASELRYAFLWDLDFAGAELAPVMQRLCHLTRGSAIHVFATNEQIADGWREFLNAAEAMEVGLADLRTGGNWSRPTVTPIS